MTLDLTDEEAAALPNTCDKRSLKSTTFLRAGSIPPKSILAKLELLPSPNHYAAETRAEDECRPREAETLSGYSGPRMTFSNAAAASVRLHNWCLDCDHRSEPHAAEMTKRYGGETAFPNGARG